MPSLNVNEKSGASWRSGFGAGRVVVVPASRGATVVDIASPEGATVDAGASGTAEIGVEAVPGVESAPFPPQAARTTTRMTKDQKRTMPSYGDRCSTDTPTAPNSCFVSIMARTSTDHGEVHRIHHEVMGLADVVRQGNHIVERQVDGPIAHFAYEMMMRIEIAQMDDRGTVTEVDVIDRPTLGEGFERPIHGRRVDPGAQPRLRPFSQKLGGQVLMTCVGEHLTHDHPGPGDTHARGSEGSDQILGRRSRHVSCRTRDSPRSPAPECRRLRPNRSSRQPTPHRRGILWRVRPPPMQERR